MVAEKVEIITQSHQDSPGSTLDMRRITRIQPRRSRQKRIEEQRSSYIYAEDSTEFLEEARIRELLNKYNKFMPFPIKFGTKEETLPPTRGRQRRYPTRDPNGGQHHQQHPPAPGPKPPADLKEEDLQILLPRDVPHAIRRAPVQHPPQCRLSLQPDRDPLFPKNTKRPQPPKRQNPTLPKSGFCHRQCRGNRPRIFDPMLRGVIDSPDIPLNVSRSYLQADGAVKKISNYITRKVADKLSSLFKKDRKGL